VAQDLLRLLAAREQAAQRKLRSCKPEELVVLQKQLDIYDEIRKWFRPSPVGDQFRPR
jgi:hypothetical protein